MPQNIRNLAIDDATFGYNLGDITFAVRSNKAGVTPFKRYRLSFGIDGVAGFQLEVASVNEKGNTKTDNNGIIYEPKKHITDEQLIDIIGSDHWTNDTFIAMCQGFASGLELGKMLGQQEEEKHARRVGDTTGVGSHVSKVREFGDDGVIDR